MSEGKSKGTDDGRKRNFSVFRSSMTAVAKTLRVSFSGDAKRLRDDNMVQSISFAQSAMALLKIYRERLLKLHEGELGGGQRLTVERKNVVALCECLQQLSSATVHLHALLWRSLFERGVVESVQQAEQQSMILKELIQSTQTGHLLTDVLKLYLETTRHTKNKLGFTLRTAAKSIANPFLSAANQSIEAPNQSAMDDLRRSCEEENFMASHGFQTSVMKQDFLEVCFIHSVRAHKALI